jgi:superfamily II DNA helicase RecQ
MFVVTPLNVLGKQNETILREAGLPAIAVSAENANEETFNVSFTASEIYKLTMS